jgi:abortive infection bacteriophage resistance protein
MPKKTFNKPALPILEQISLYESRGLIFKNKAWAAQRLSFISYYRLSGYAKYFTLNNDDEHRFVPNTQFEDIINLYNFDRKLRLLIMDAIETIEVALRTIMSNTMSNEYGSHWYSSATHFQSSEYHDRFLSRVEEESGFNTRPGSFKEKKQNSICKHYFEQYDKPPLPPSWMIAEILSIGTWSMVFEKLLKKNKKLVAKEFDLHPELLQSWLHSVTYLRNICAHHSRCWNLHFKIAPIEQKINKKHFLPNYSLYAQLSMIQVLLGVIDKKNTWSKNLYDLLNQYSWIPIGKMGFPKNWEKDPFWNLGDKR